MASGDHRARLGLALLILAWMLTLVAAAQESPKVAFRESGEGFRIGRKIRVLDAADASITQFMDDWLVEESPSWGPDGETLVASGRREDRWDIFRSRGGSRVWLTEHPADDRVPAWSPDGQRVAFMSSRDERNNIYLMDTDGSNVRRLTNDPWNSATPSWSPRGDAIVYVYATETSTQLRIIDVVTKEVRTLTPALSVLEGSTILPAWSVDGKFVAYAHDTALGEADIEVVTVGGKERWSVTEGVDAPALYPAWTPAGDISFSLGDGKQSDIAVTGLRGGGVQLLTDSTTVKESPAWYNPRFFAVRTSSILSLQTWDG